MLNSWRISTLNGALLACYFVPTWTIVALKIVISPIHGFYEPPNVAVALFAGDYLQLAAAASVRMAWLLALAKLTVAAFFAVFLVLLFRASSRQSDDSDETLAIALAIGAAISFGSMVMASKVGEAAALRLHATELLMLLGAAIVLLIDRKRAASRSTPPADGLALQQA